MRLLLSADPLGGVWTYALDLSRALAERDVSVVLAVIGGPLSPDQRADLRSLELERVFLSEARLEWMHDPWEDVRRSGEWLLEIERQLAPDLVQLSSYSHAALPWRVPALVVAHSCVLSWFEAVRREPAPPEWERYRHEVERGLQAAAAVVAPTAAMLAALRRHYSFERPCYVVPNGRHRDAVWPAAKEPFVLACGRLWDEGKNLVALDRAAEGLIWPVQAAGEPVSPDGYAPAFPHVELLGRLDALLLGERLARASIFASPARYEPFGLAPLEAALAGCALVLGDIPSLREVWGEDALFVDPEEPAELHEALRSLIDDPARRLALARAARRRALTLGPERMAEGYLDVYARLLESAREAA